MKHKLSQNITYWLGVAAIGLVVGLSLQFVCAWTEPSVAPPGGNVGAPVNTGDNSQLKLGNLALNTNGTYAIGLLVPNGKVGIGTTAPDPRAKLEVNGNVYAGSGESHFWYGTYSDPHENVPYAIKVAGSGGVGSIAASGNAVFMNGNVGIGTTGPKSLLHIKSDSPSVNAMINLESDLGIVNQIYTGRSAGGAPGHLVIEPATGKNTIINNGNVGIGTTVDPGTNKLQVNGKIQAIGGDICTDQGGGKCLSTAGGGGLTYVGSCSVNWGGTCKCNKGETIMMLTVVDSPSCSVENQNTGSVYGGGNNSGYACGFACFK